MPAPDLETLLDFEGILEDSFKDYLATNITDPACQLAVTKDTIELQTPRIQIQYDDGGAIDDLQYVENAGGDNSEYLSYTGNLMLTIVTDNTNDTQRVHRSLRNQIRALLQRNRMGLALQYYNIRYIRPVGTQLETSGDYFMTTLSFQVTISIIPSEYPTQ